MSRPPILIFSLAPLNALGGAEIAVKELTTRLASQFEFEVISANINSFWSKYLYPFWASRRAIRQHRAKKYDLVWAIMANQAGLAAAQFKKKFPEVPFLLTLQEGDDLDSLTYRARLLFPKIFGVFKRANHIQAISNYLAGWARQMGASCPITVIPNGVDLGKIKPRENNSEKIIITTSRLVYKNGIDLLIKALAFLPPDIRLEILGEGPERGALKALAESQGVAARASFLGQVDSSLVGQYLARASVFARPSRSEGLGNSFLEAMAIGLPVVGTPVGGIPDFLKDGETGWLCAVDNPESLAEKIKFILEPGNREQVARVVARARDLVYGNYDWEQLARRMGDLFRHLIGGQS